MNINMDHGRACHSPPLLMRPSSGQQRLQSAGSAQGSPVMRSSSNTYSRLGSGSFRGHEADM
jgi:hypothetical protein